MPELLDVDAALRALRRVDPSLRPLIARHGPPNYRRTRSAFQSLTHAIIYQQLAGAAAATIYGRFLELFPRPGRRFPRPAEVASVSARRLRSAGLSRAKAEYVQALANAFVAGDIKPRRFSRMSDAQISEMLTAVRGIGQWSADMFLMFGLNRPDVLPTGDYAVRVGMQLHFKERGLPTPKRMLELGESWRPYRSIASWYMWRVKESE